MTLISYRRRDGNEKSIYLILLALRSENFGFTFSSPITEYNLTIQNTAALRTIDSSTSANCKYFF